MHRPRSGHGHGRGCLKRTMARRFEGQPPAVESSERAIGCPLADISGTMQVCDHASFPMNLWKKRGDEWTPAGRTMEDACVGRLESCNECIRLEIQWRWDVVLCGPLGWPLRDSEHVKIFQTAFAVRLPSKAALVPAFLSITARSKLLPAKSPHSDLSVVPTDYPRPVTGWRVL